jgi:hypothetical protein
MRSAAELKAEIAELTDIHPVAVFVAEKHQRAHFLCLLKRDIPVMLQWNTRVDFIIHKIFDCRQLSLGYLAEMREIETKMLGIDKGAGLVHMRAQDFSKGSMQQMRGAVVAHDRKAALFINTSYDFITMRFEFWIRF